MGTYDYHFLADMLDLIIIRGDRSCHEVLIAFFIVLQIQTEAGLRRPVLAGAGWYWMLRPASAWIGKKIKNSLYSGYFDLMGRLILTTSP